MTWLRSVGLRLLLAFCCSFALWIFVAYTQNPDRRIRLDNIPVDIVGLQPGLIIVDNNGLPRNTRSIVNVSIEGPASDLQNVSERDITAFLDAEGHDVGQYVLDVNVRSVRTDRLRLQFTPDPFRLPVRIEREITRTVALTITVNGSVPFSYEAGRAEASLAGIPLQEVLVRGPENRVEQVVAVRADVDIDRLTSTYNSPRLLEAITADGRVLDGVTLEPQQVNVQVPILSSVGSKRVPIVPQLFGQPGDGYVIAKVTVDPQLITLTGSSGPLDEVVNISTVPFNINGVTKTISGSVGLQEPPGVRLRYGEPVAALVTVEIVPLLQSYQVTLPLPVQVVGVPDGLIVGVNPTIVQVVFSGSGAQLARLDSSALKAVANVRGLDPGVYTVDLSIDLPANSGLRVQAPKVQVSLRLPPTELPAPRTAAPTSVPTTATPSTSTPAPEQPSPSPLPEPSSVPTVPAQPTQAPEATLVPEPTAQP